MNTLEAVVLKQCVATHDFVGVAATDLHLRKGDILDVLDVRFVCAFRSRSLTHHDPLCRIRCHGGSA
jgi:hypothetical protein